MKILSWYEKKMLALYDMIVQTNQLGGWLDSLKYNLKA